MSFDSDIANYVNYLAKANPTVPSETIRNALLWQIASSLSIGSSSSDPATATNQQQLFASFAEFLAENATEAKQDEAIALLNKLTQQLDFANGIGAVQPSQTAIATTTPIEILPQSATRKRVRITNHATIATDFIIFDLNDNDNSFNSGTNSVQGRILAPGDTWESPGREEARARISILSGTNNDVPISYQETFDSVFSIGEQVTLAQNLNIVDIRYRIAIVGATAVLNAMTVELYEEGVENAIATNNYSSGLIPGSTINADFLGLDGFNGTEPKEFYIIVTEG